MLLAFFLFFLYAGGGGGFNLIDGFPMSSIFFLLASNKYISRNKKIICISSQDVKKVVKEKSFETFSPFL